MESAFVLAEKPLLEILTHVRNGLPAPMFEQLARWLRSWELPVAP